MEVGTVGALRSGDPRRLGDYVLVGRLGEGGQGAVYLGRRHDGAEHYAIKLLHGELTDDTTARARFVREVELAKQVASFCTAGILEVGVEEDRPFIVTEYVNGPSLRRHVDQHGPLRGGALDRLAIGMATALVAIHQAGVVHRDFKPANVLLGPDGPRVIDFGIAKALGGSVTISSQVVGTPAYMAPEQLRGEPAGRPADVFAWAAVIVYAATGIPPFGQDTIPAVVNRILSAEPNLGEMSGPLGGLIVRCLDKDAERRPDARRILLHLLGQEEASGQPMRAEPVPPAPGTAIMPPPGRSADATVATNLLFEDGEPAAAATSLDAAADSTVPTRRMRPAWIESWRARGLIAAAAAILVAGLTMLIVMNTGHTAHSTGDNTGHRKVPAAVDPTTRHPAPATPRQTHTDTPAQPNTEAPPPPQTSVPSTPTAPVTTPPPHTTPPVTTPPTETPPATGHPTGSP